MTFLGGKKIAVSSSHLYLFYEYLSATLLLNVVQLSVHHRINAKKCTNKGVKMFSVASCFEPILNF